MNLDFIIPCHPKDKDVVHQGVISIKEKTNCNNIYLISPCDLKIDGTIQILDSEFDNLTSLQKLKDRWNVICPKWSHRAGWIYQQTLKLLSHKVIQNLTESYVMVDSDAIFTKKVHYDCAKFQYCIAPEYHTPYLETYEKLIGKPTNSGFSFIFHHMIFNKKYMNELICHIENLHEMKLYDALLKCINYEEGASLSEWDLYGNWMWDNHKEICENRQLNYINVGAIPNKTDIEYLANKYDIVCCHGWARGKDYDQL